MSCPFYGNSLTVLLHYGAGIGTNGNQCALITSAHSPCWMQVAEGRDPSWIDCPRNPEFVAETFRSEAAMRRWNEHANHMDGLRVQRAIAAVRELGPGFKPLA